LHLSLFAGEIAPLLGGSEVNNLVASRYVYPFRAYLAGTAAPNGGC
jgi:hypothetical protein